MSVTSDTSSHGKKFRWQKSYLVVDADGNMRRKKRIGG